MSVKGESVILQNARVLGAISRHGWQTGGVGAHPVDVTFGADMEKGASSVVVLRMSRAQARTLRTQLNRVLG